MAKKYAGAGTGSGASFTPDPTVNGPWTHTRPDIPLFKPAPAAGAATPGGAGTPAPGRGPARDPSAGGMGGVRPGGVGGANPKFAVNRFSIQGNVANPKISVPGPSPFGSGPMGGTPNPKISVPGPSPFGNGPMGGTPNPRIVVDQRGSGMALGGSGRGLPSSPATPQLEDPPLPPYDAGSNISAGAPPVAQSPVAPAPGRGPALNPSAGGMSVSAPAAPRFPMSPAMGNPNQNPMGGGYRTRLANALARPTR